MNDIYSFYQLICKYQIEIPIIQRDYAQGRDNAKAADVRRSLVENMIKSVVKDDNSLFFDFVYGRVDGNRFIPFDGQQRLTTLFLFHKYIFERCQSKSICRYRDNCVCKDILKRFSYATRQSSREFCEKLVENRIIPIDDKLVSANIINQPWFFPDWKKDPTIVGMMRMLDEIHKKFDEKENEVDFKHCAEKLTSGCNCPITFHFVDMGEHKLSDETYVKMNARGKSLTPFENFKASLEQYLEEKKDVSEEKKDVSLLDRYRKSMDSRWLDLFWSVANPENRENKELPDSLMMSFFNRHFMNVWRCWYAQNQNEENERINQRVINEMQLYPTKDSFVSWDIYQHILENCGVEECLNTVFNIWDALCDNESEIYDNCQAIWNRGKNDNERWNLYKGTVNNDNRETYPSRIAFYALMKYYDKNANLPVSCLSQWMRVVWNMIENSIIDSRQTYHAALRLIESLSLKCGNIYYALAKQFDDFGLGTMYHAKEQITEEVVKAKKIIDEALWENSIIEAEKCPYLTGKVWVLFQDGENTSLSLFNQRLQLLKEILANPDKYYLPKILISYYDKSRPDNPIDLKENNWKTLLTDEGRKGLFSCFQKIQNNSTNDKITYQWIRDLANTQLLNNSREDAKIVSQYGKHVVLWGTSGCRKYVFGNEVWGNVVIGNHRTLLVDSKVELRKKERIVSNTNFVTFFDVDFKYNGFFYRWYGEPNDNELDVYLMENEWKDYKERKYPKNDKGTDEDKYFCFKVTEDMNGDVFILKLMSIVNQYEDENK